MGLDNPFPPEDPRVARHITPQKKYLPLAYNNSTLWDLIMTSLGQTVPLLPLGLLQFSIHQGGIYYWNNPVHQAGSSCFVSQERQGSSMQQVGLTLTGSCPYPWAVSTESSLSKQNKSLPSSRLCASNPETNSERTQLIWPQYVLQTQRKENLCFTPVGNSRFRRLKCR